MNGGLITAISQRIMLVVPAISKAIHVIQVQPAQLSSADTA
jgi:hypothetical protein